MPILHYIAPILPVRDMERSVAFYKRLGFSHRPYEDGAHYAFLSLDGLSLHLAEGSGPEFHFNPCAVYFYVEDVDSFFEAVVSAGITTIDTPEDRPWGLREFAVSDPDQTLLRFGQLLSPGDAD